MIWLVLSIICSTLIFVIFKYFDQFKIDNLQAIIVNYIVASSLGMALRGFDTSIIEIPEKNWFWSAFILGIIFIWLFRLMALASQKIGVSVVSITVKMSLVIPVLFGVFYYHESIGLVKVLGISIALLAVYLTTAKDKAKKSSGLYIKLPLILFFGSGIMDTFINFNQEEIVSPEEHGLFTSSIFGMAAVFGSILLMVQHFRSKIKLEIKNIWAGIILGIPNYGSIYFLIRSLNHNNMESSIVFPINNVGIVALSVLFAVLLFSEKLNVKNKIGIALALISIALLGFDSFD
tara:strand:- start:68341 stop:69213 length:873 start_codon:yes stop_codon:yes gene_type:complete